MARERYSVAGEALHRESENPAMEYLSDVAKGFCDSKEIRSKYGDLVGHICKKLFNDVSCASVHSAIECFILIRCFPSRLLATCML